MNAKLAECFKKLRLSGMAQTLAVRLQEAAANRLDHAEFLELVLADEMAVRHERSIGRGLTAAAFRDQKTLEDFQWDFNRTIKRKQIYDLAAGAFVRQRRDVLLVGPPGVGKSHLVQAIGRQLIHAGFAVYYRSIFDTVRDFLHDEAFEGHDRVMAKYLKPDLLILDDMGLKQLPKSIYTMLIHWTTCRSCGIGTIPISIAQSSCCGPSMESVGWSNFLTTCSA